MQENKNLDDVLMSPVFIVGAERSGTTWLQRMFLSHPDVIGGQESEFFLNFTPVIGSVKKEQKDNKRKVGLSSYWNEQEFYEELRKLWDKTFRPLSDGAGNVKLLIEKTPSHCIHMAAIKEVLPQSKFIHIIRDSRAVVSSILAASRGWGKNWAPSSAKKAAVSWWTSVNAGQQNGIKLSSNEYMEVHYETLLANPVEELRRMFDFSGLSYDGDLIAQIVEVNNFKKQKSSTEAAFTTHKGEQLVEPKGFHRKGTADSWKSDLSLMEKLITWRYTRKLMGGCGYTWGGYVGQDKANKKNA